MELKDIVAIAGQSGLHKIVGRSKNGLIVETIGTGRRFSTSFQDKVSVLEDISIYTVEEDLRLNLVLIKLKEAGEVPTAKEDMKKLREFLIATINLDSERVYDNDIKKLLNWYHALKDILDFAKLAETDSDNDSSSEASGEEKSADTEVEATTEEVKPKKVAAKKATTPKATAPKSAPKANSKGAGGSKTTYRPKSV